MMYSNSSLYLLMSSHTMGALQLGVTWAKASGTGEINGFGKITELTMQVSKYILSFFVDRYSVSVVIVAPLLATDEFFADCGCPNFLVDMITTHCRSHRQLEGSHFCEQRPY